MTRKRVESISGEHPVSVKELLVNASEGACVAEHMPSKRDRQFSSFLSDNQDKNTQNIPCHFMINNKLKLGEVYNKAADIHVEFEITHWGFFATTQLDTGSDQIGLTRYRCQQLSPVSHPSLFAKPRDEATIDELTLSDEDIT